MPAPAVPGRRAAGRAGPGRPRPPRPVDGFGAQTQRAFLDAAGAPLRNVHKFDVVLRLPLVLGLAHLVGLVLRAARTGDRPRTGRAAAPGATPVRLRAGLVTGTALVAVAAVAAPALGGGLAAPGQLPGRTRLLAAGVELAGPAVGDDRVLVVPAARFPRYLWGSPQRRDHPAAVDRPGRSAARCRSPRRAPSGCWTPSSRRWPAAQGSAGLADLLARSGVQYLLLRSDLDYGHSGATQPVVVRQALAALTRHPPGTRVRPRGRRRPLPATSWTAAWTSGSGRWRCTGRPRVDQVVAYDAADLTTVVGGPESLLPLAAAGRLSAAPTVLAGDRPGRAGRTAGDAHRRAAPPGGRLRAAARQRLGDPDRREPPRLDAPARDYLPDVGRRWESPWCATSASAGCPRPAPGLRRSRWAGTPRTPAVRGARRRPGHLLAVRAGDPRAGAVVRGGAGPAAGRPATADHLRHRADSLPTKITVTAGRQQATVQTARADRRRGPARRLPTRFVRVTVGQVSTSGAGFGGVGIAELVIPGVEAARTLVVPAPAGHRPARRGGVQRGPVLPVVRLRRGPAELRRRMARASEDGDRIDRTVQLPVGAGYQVGLRARPRPGAALTPCSTPVGGGGHHRGHPDGRPPRPSACPTRPPGPARWWTGTRDHLVRRRRRPAAVAAADLAEGAHHHRPAAHPAAHRRGGPPLAGHRDRRRGDARRGAGRGRHAASSTGRCAATTSPC